MTTTKGYLYAVLSSLFLSTGFIATKHFLQFANPLMVAFLFFLTASLITTFIIFLKPSIAFLPLVRQHWKSGLIIGVVNSMGAFFWFQAVDLIGPSLTAFLLRLSTIFAIALGIIFLKERLSAIEIFGTAIALLGVWLISSAEGGYKLFGLSLAIGAAFIFALQQLLSKLFLRKMRHLLLANFRLSFSALFLGLFVAATGRLEPFPLQQVPLLALAALTAPVLGFLFFYKSLELLDVSKTAIIRNLDPFVVVLYAFIAFSNVPSQNDIIGGTLIVLGVAISILGHRLTNILKLFRWAPW